MTCRQFIPMVLSLTLILVIAATMTGNAAGELGAKSAAQLVQH